MNDATAAGKVERRPALSPWCRVLRDKNRYLVELGGTVVTFEGRAAGTLLPRLLPLLDGTRTMDDLIGELGTSVEPAIEHAVSLLDRNRLLVDGLHGSGTDGDSTAAAAYAVAVTPATAEATAARALSQARLAILGMGAGAEHLADLVREMGVDHVDRHPLDAKLQDATLVVAMPANEEIHALPAVNERALETDSVWLQVLPFDGRFVVVGPLFLPGASACHACYLLRRGACSGYEDDFELVHALPLRLQPPSPLAAVGAGLAAVLALRWITASDPTLPGRFYALESRAVLRLSHNLVLRVPRCTSCGTPERGVPSPWFDRTR